MQCEQAISMNGTTPGGQTGMGQVFTFGRVGQWNTLQVKMLHWHDDPMNYSYDSVGQLFSITMMSMTKNN